MKLKHLWSSQQLKHRNVNSMDHQQQQKHHESVCLQQQPKSENEKHVCESSYYSHKRDVTSANQTSLRSGGWSWEITLTTSRSKIHNVSQCNVYMFFDNIFEKGTDYPTTNIYIIICISETNQHVVVAGLISFQGHTSSFFTADVHKKTSKGRTENQGKTYKVLQTHTLQSLDQVRSMEV